MRRRYLAPARAAVDSACFAQPIFDGVRRHTDWLTGRDWPTLAVLNAALGAPSHPHSGAPLRFIEQTTAQLADGRHYEQRIFERGEIATRAESWHDLFNALVWIEHSALKAALNARQAADIAAVGPRQRTRAQCALTHFDEAGVIVLLRDPGLVSLWDAHDWSALFWREQAAWTDGRVELVVIGHALWEHALCADPMITAKCLALQMDDATDACTKLAAAIAAREALLDPQELRPLPLSGIPGWHARTAEPAFYLDAPCFRPLRAGRRYPPPLLLR